MKQTLKRLLGSRLILIPVDLIISPFTLFSALFLRFLRQRGFTKLFFSKNILLKVGMFPILDHYYDPLFNPKNLRHSLRDDRLLPGIDLNDSEQLHLLDTFDYQNEVMSFPVKKENSNLEFYYNNGSFCSGDAEYLYSIIRHFKPRKIVEIGSGNSTLMAVNALKKNSSESKNYHCEHICIEPYEMKWLEQLDVTVIRKKVEDIDLSYFTGMKANDILFIDSSHMIRPQGDVLFEYLEILPLLQKGVLIHIHDIFTPKDYLDEWFGTRFWNEQYLLEAFLSNNKEFRIVGATNYLSHKYYDKFASKCPIFKNQNGREPGSFWMIRN